MTARGRAHADRLRLNRPPLVEYRRERRLAEAARRAEQQLLERLRELDGRLEQLVAELERLRAGGS